MYKLIAVLAVALLVMPAFAEKTATLAPGAATFTEIDGFTGSRAGCQTVYSNTTNNTGYFTSNTGYEIGDEMSFATMDPPLEPDQFVLCGFDIGWCDLTTAGAYTSVTIRFYEDPGCVGPGAYIWGINITGLPGYGCWTTHIDAEAFNVAVPQNGVYASYDFGNPGSTDGVGPMLYSPPTIGTSCPGVYSIGDGYGWWGAGYDLYFGIQLVPEPMTILLLAGGAVALLRRR